MIQKPIFEDLLQYQNQPCVTIYITTIVAGDYEKNRIKWKNACAEARKELEIKFPDAVDMLDPANDLIDNMDFWAHQSKCLVGFYTKGFNKYFHLASVQLDLVSVHHDFYTSPLIREVKQNDRLFVLALSKNETKFYEAVPDGIYEVFIDDVVAKNMEEALNLDEDMTSLQHHTVRAGNAGFHANGPGQDNDQVRTRQYLQKIDDGLMNIIHDEKVPLILASVEEYHPVYSEITSYNHFSDHLVAGNPEHTSAPEMHAHLKPVFEEMEAKTIADFNTLYGEKHAQNLATNQIDAIANSAKFKNVHSIILSEQYLNKLDKDEMEKIDDIVMQTYQSGGNIILTRSDDESCQLPRIIKRFEMEL